MRRVYIGCINFILEHGNLLGVCGFSSVTLGKANFILLTITLSLSTWYAYGMVLTTDSQCFQLKKSIYTSTYDSFNCMYSLLRGPVNWYSLSFKSFRILGISEKHNGKRRGQ